MAKKKLRAMTDEEFTRETSGIEPSIRVEIYHKGEESFYNVDYTGNEEEKIADLEELINYCQLLLGEFKRE